MLSNTFRDIIANLNYPETEVLIQLPNNPEHGDFSTNLAMHLGGKLGTDPQNIAKVLIDKLTADYPHLVDSAEIAGPGFINISINILVWRNILYYKFHALFASPFI